MKKNLIWMVSLLLAVAVTLGASRLSAQNKVKKPASPRTRIAFINLTYVIKNYEKYQQFQVEIKEIIKPFQERDAVLRKQLAELRIAELREQSEETTIVPARGEDDDKKATKKEFEAKAKKIEQAIKDNAAEIKLKLGKRSDDAMKSLFMDVEEVTQRYANSHDLDLVLHYNDAITEDDLHSAQNIARKLNTGALMPVYWNPSMDISQDIVAVLNRKARDN